MGKPAARLTDMHICPKSEGRKPHVGGPISGPGCPSVLIAGLPAARMGDMCICIGPPDTIVGGSSGVMIGGRPAARMGDPCAHGGKIVVGCPTVLIGEVSTPVITPIEVVKLQTPSEEKKIEKTEIQFKLLDQDGEPIAGENYKVTLPDGSIRNGKTDDKGEVHITGIDPGNCKISFPDIDGSNWA